MPVRKSALLCEFTDEELGTLASYLQLLDIGKGQRLFEQDQPGDSLYIVLDGELAVMRKVNEHGQIRDRTLAVVGPGESAGEMALADGQPRSATITTLTPVSVLRLGIEKYEELRQGKPNLALKLELGIVRLLSKRIRQINKSLETAQLLLFAS